MKRALIIAAIILLIAAVVGLVFLGGLMMNNYAETGSVFGSGFDLSGGFWENVIGDEVLGGIDTSPRPSETDEKFTDPSPDRTDGDEDIYIDDEDPYVDYVDMFIFNYCGDGNVEVSLNKYYSAEEIVIPSTYDGKTVFRIAKDAFLNRSDIKKIVLPDTIKAIYANAFSGCSSLSEIVLPDGVERIEQGAFEGCSSLKSINFPSSVTLINDRAFKGCTSLTSVILPPEFIRFRRKRI